VDKNNCTLLVCDGKEWEKTGKPLKSLGGCNFRKGNYLRFCRESDSQCGGQEFDPPLLHHLASSSSISLETDKSPQEAVAVFTGDDEGLDHFRLLEVAVEMVQLV